MALTNTFIPAKELVVDLRERVYSNLLETGGLPVTMPAKEITANAAIYTRAVNETLVLLKHDGYDIPGKYKKQAER